MSTTSPNVASIVRRSAATATSKVSASQNSSRAAVVVSDSVSSRTAPWWRRTCSRQSSKALSDAVVARVETPGQPRPVVVGRGEVDAGEGHRA
ncbi:hypothetical protein [Salinigranum sp. GCM10025319]|uniref:hypothetical protein n=1 Tax=Salinigranum sp. GCM10025319 TaxID=3252687 RepID=UPI00361DF4F3